MSASDCDNHLNMIYDKLRENKKETEKRIESTWSIPFFCLAINDNWNWLYGNWTEVKPAKIFSPNRNIVQSFQGYISLGFLLKEMMFSSFFLSEGGIYVLHI